MIKIKKCPFCGRSAELRHDKEGFSYVLCANDGCYVRTDGHLNDESAIKAWNTRIPVDDVVEALKKPIWIEHTDDLTLNEIAETAIKQTREVAIERVKEILNE